MSCCRQAEKIKVGAGGPCGHQAREGRVFVPNGSLSVVFQNQSARPPILRPKTPAITRGARPASGVPHIICFEERQVARAGGVVALAPHKRDKGARSPPQRSRPRGPPPTHRQMRHGAGAEHLFTLRRCRRRQTKATPARPPCINQTARSRKQNRASPVVFASHAKSSGDISPTTKGSLNPKWLDRHSTDARTSFNEVLNGLHVG